MPLGPGGGGGTPVGTSIPYPPIPPQPEREYYLHCIPTPRISIFCPPLPSLPGSRNEFPTLSPPGKGSGSQLEEGGGIGLTGQPSASPLPWCCSAFQPHRRSHCQGQIRCSWRLAPAATVLTPSGPHPDTGRQLRPWSPSTEPLPCRGLAGLCWPRAGVGESRASDPVALATKHPSSKEKKWTGKTGSLRVGLWLLLW